MLPLPREVYVGPLEIAFAESPGGMLPAQADGGCHGAEAHEVSSGDCWLPTSLSAVPGKPVSWFPQG